MAESTRDHLIRRGIPACMADDLAAEGADDPEWLEEMVRMYLDADEVSRADIRAFHESGGPEMVQDAIDRLGPGEEAARDPAR